MESGEQNPIGSFITLTEGWKAAQKRFAETAGIAPGSTFDVVAARAAESDRHTIYSALQYEISRLRAGYPNDPTLRVAWEQLQTRKGFLRFGEAEGITPHLEAVIQRFAREAGERRFQQGSATPEFPLGIQGSSGPAQAKQGSEPIHAVDLEAIRRNWFQEGWPARLLQARDARAMAQKAAAYECTVSVATYKRWERGKQRPASRHMVCLLKFIRAGAET